MNVEEQVGSFIVETRWDGLPKAVRNQARLCMVDDLGAALSGTLTRASRIMGAYAAETWPGDEATILLRGRRVGAVGAAFANAWAANAFDSDDGLRYAYGHGGAQIFPTALAAAELRGLDGGRMLVAMVVGYEVAHRVGRCWHDSRQVYQACGSWGSVACAATAAHLMGLTPEQAWGAGRVAAAERALSTLRAGRPSRALRQPGDRRAPRWHGVPIGRSGWGLELPQPGLEPGEDGGEVPLAGGLRAR